MATDKTNYHVKVQLNADSTPGVDKFVIWDESEENFTLGDVDRVYIICKQVQPGPGYVTFDITQPQGGVLYETSSYMKAEFYGLRTGSTDQRYQSARTVATWLKGEGSGNPPTRFSTFEDVRSPDDKIIYNIKTVTGSWQNTLGNTGDTLRVSIYQYNIDDVDYCLRYVVF